MIKTFTVEPQYPLPEAQTRYGEPSIDFVVTCVIAIAVKPIFFLKNKASWSCW